MKYKVGDRVKIREDLECGMYYGNICFLDGMTPFRGTYVTIIRTTKSCNYITEETSFILSEEMFEDKIMEDFNIVDYKVHDNDGVKSVVVEFKDGTKEHAVCCNGDTFELERGIEICVMKYIFGQTGYKSMIRKAMKQIKEIDKAADNNKKIEELIARKKAKNERRKARYRANRRARRVAEMKEAYLGALKEYGIAEFFEDSDNLK